LLLFIIAKNTQGGEIKLDIYKQWNTHSSLKGKEILIYVIQMNFENVMLRVIRQM
jgi:hypothetical protein